MPWTSEYPLLSCCCGPCSCCPGFIAAVNPRVLVWTSHRVRLCRGNRMFATFSDSHCVTWDLGRLLPLTFLVYCTAFRLFSCNMCTQIVMSLTNARHITSFRKWGSLCTGTSDANASRVYCTLLMDFNFLARGVIPFRTGTFEIKKGRRKIGGYGLWSTTFWPIEFESFLH